MKEYLNRQVLRFITMIFLKWDKIGTLLFTDNKKGLDFTLSL